MVNERSIVKSLSEYRLAVTGGFREENMKVKIRVFEFEVRGWSGFNNEKTPFGFEKKSKNGP